jgi:predicted  nucleic acid-binding Zn-ribbon protein
LEDEILNILETADQRSQQVSAEKEKLARSRELGDQKRKTWGQKLVETEARLAHLLQERVEKISGLDRGLLQAYTRIFENRQGLVVVPVKNGSCSGCFVTLTPQSYQEARKNDRIIFCSSCNRILYWKE